LSKEQTVGDDYQIYSNPVTSTKAKNAVGLDDEDDLVISIYYLRGQLVKQEDLRNIIGVFTIIL